MTITTNAVGIGTTQLNVFFVTTPTESRAKKVEHVTLFPNAAGGLAQFDSINDMRAALTKSASNLAAVFSSK
jgi:hypothetical protein